MTIDEAIKWFKESPFCHEDHEPFNMAIDTMRKYQKIEKIVNAWNDMNSFDSMVQISEVLEDGKTD